MRIKWSDLKRTAAQPALRSSFAGTALTTVFVLVIYFFDAEYSARLPLAFVIGGGLLIMFGPVPSTYRLVRGTLAFAAWKRQLFWLVVFGWSVWVGHLAAYIPRYAPVLFILYSSGGGLGVGLFSRFSYILNTGFMVANFVISLWLISPAEFQQFRLEVLLVALATMVGAAWFGRLSRYYIQQNESAAKQLRFTRRDRRLISEERKKSDGLLLNILPVSVADELKATGKTEPVHFDAATVLFTDFQGFTLIAESLSPKDLVKELDQCFSYFDATIARYNLEKLKTIGDSYMCAGGVPEANQTHAVDTVLAALEIQAFMNRMKAIKVEQGLPYWELRLGIHTGPLVAGVIGEKKFAYDVWGDTVNIASRCESSGVAGRINISGAVHERVRDLFECEYRGRVPAKHKGEIDMYFVNGVRPEFSVDGAGEVPNDSFRTEYARLSGL
ncbi:MAG: adenylate/guanylate cyclase domain-containing protein [bacterium]|nr:adenylate/guanylate cyclase domain-containing protein [bacterium]